MVGLRYKWCLNLLSPYLTEGFCEHAPPQQSACSSLHSGAHILQGRPAIRGTDAGGAPTGKYPGQVFLSSGHPEVQEEA